MPNKVGNFHVFFLLSKQNVFWVHICASKLIVSVVVLFNWELRYKMPKVSMGSHASSGLQLAPLLPHSYIFTGVWFYSSGEWWCDLISSFLISIVLDHLSVKIPQFHIHCSHVRDEKIKVWNISWKTPSTILSNKSKEDCKRK